MYIYKQGDDWYKNISLYSLYYLSNAVCVIKKTSGNFVEIEINIFANKCTQDEKIFGKIEWPN